MPNKQKRTKDSPVSISEAQNSVLTCDENISSTERIISLMKKLEKLHYLCSNYLPQDDSPAKEIQSLLTEFKLKEDPNNPFHVQNQILVLTDNTENELKLKFQ